MRPNYLLTVFLEILERIAVGFVKPITFVTRGFLPYVTYVIDSTARFALYVAVSAPLLVGALWASSFIVGPGALGDSLTASDALISEWVRLIKGNIHYFGLVVAGYYLFFGVVPYRPHDKQFRDYRRRNAPEGPYEWEDLLIGIITLSPIATTFAVSYFATERLSDIPGGIVGLSIGSVVLVLPAFVASRRMFREQWLDGEFSLEYETLGFMSSLLMLIVGVGLPFLATGIPAGILGIASIVESLFYATFLSMAYVARHLRYTLYLDRDGLLNIEPNIRLWGAVSRVPLAYGAVVVIVGGFESVKTLGFPVFCVFAPLAAALGYLVFRYVQTNGMMYRTRERKKYDPDDYNVMRDIAWHSELFSREMADAFLPENKLWSALRSGRDALEEVNRQADRYDDFTGMRNRSLPFKLASDMDTSYSLRKKRIRQARSALRPVEQVVDQKDEDEVPVGLREAIDEAHRSLDEAEELNEKVGMSDIERLKEGLFG